MSLAVKKEENADFVQIEFHRTNQRFPEASLTNAEPSGQGYASNSVKGRCSTW
jgi:hypothetical protein